MKGILHIIFAFLCVFSIAHHAIALDDTFTISASVISNDVTAPSVPTGLVATPVSVDQINISWNPSTDNVAVAGYRLYRDGLFIATTTGESFIDHGLSHTTTYEYSVDAFDAALNISLQSGTTSATTLSPAPPMVPEEGGGISSYNKGWTKFEEDISVFPNTTYALISWNTVDPMKAQVYWGATPDYELGTVSEIFYQTSHEVRLENLSPHTLYYMKVVMINGSGKKFVYETTFVTLDDTAFLPPINIKAFKATPEGKNVLLSWKNADQATFDGVRIVRSELFFPMDQFDGKVVFEGSGKESFLDTTLVSGVTYYYAIFAKDKSENYSSGVLLKVIKNGDGRVVVVQDANIFDEVPASDTYVEALQEVSLSDFTFVQQGKAVSFISGGISVDNRAPIQVTIDYNKIPRGIRLITLSLNLHTDNNKSVTVLLRPNEDKTQYQGIIPAVDHAGIYEVEINFFDARNMVVKTITAVMQVTVVAERVLTESLFEKTIELIQEYSWVVVVVVLVFLLVRFVVLRI